MNSSRKDSPVIRIDIHVEYRDSYTITRYEDLNGILGKNWNWHFRGINGNGDFCYVILSTVEFYLYHQRPIKEYFPSMSGEVQIEYRNVGDMLVFSFVKEDYQNRHV